VTRLDPALNRALYWTGPPAPLPSAIPIDSPDNQPLYGWGARGLAPLYEHNVSWIGTCFANAQSAPPECLAALRNNPLEGWDPYFTVYATSLSHVQAAVSFAAKHRLCVSVAGTGHDFLNRHSCPGGVMIRTTLIKGADWTADGTGLTLGAGMTFSEAQQAASLKNKFIASGWAKTVGVLGWSLGGGHGPFGNGVGLGVDQILGATIVVANGSVVTVSEDEHSDLWWAIRGGGGSTFGVFVNITVRAYDNPVGGFTLGRIAWVGDQCSGGQELLGNLSTGVLEWMQQLDKRWSGIAFFTPQHAGPEQCGANWSVYLQYTFLGPKSDGEAAWAALVALDPTPFYEDVASYATWYDAVLQYPFEYVIPVAWTHWGVPSVLVQRDTVASGAISSVVTESLHNCTRPGDPCPRMELYNDITGAPDSPRPANVSISPLFRTAFLHFVFGAPLDPTPFEALGGAAYLSESSYLIPDGQWQTMYWGDNWDRLVAIKAAWDPTGLFWCRHCVGDNRSFD
jgi:ribonuclease T2